MNPKLSQQMAQFTIQHTKDGISKVYKDGILTHTFPATDEFTVQHWYYDEYGVIEPTEYEGGTTIPGEGIACVVIGTTRPLEDMFSDLPPRTDWQVLRMAFTVWRCNLKGKIRNLLANKES